MTPTQVLRGARPLATLLVTALVLAACGGDDATTTDETTTTVDTETTTTVDDDADGDDATGDAASVNLTLGDLPDGWVAGPPAEEDDADDDDDLLGECLRLDGDEIEERQVDQADSPEFSNPASLEQTVSSSTTIYDDEEVPVEIFERLRDEATVPCLRQAFEDAFAEDDDGLEYEIVRFEIDGAFPTVGDESVLLVAEVVVRAEGQEIPVHIELVLIRTGAVASFASLLNVGEPNADELVVDVAEALAGRQAAVTA